MLYKSLVFATLVMLGCAPSGLLAQDDKYNDYTWAKGLYKEFGYDDVAEAIFTEMAGDASRSPTEQQQGRLGLAELKQSLARRTDEHAAKVKLYQEADALMTAVLRSWPDQTSESYFQALFTQMGLLQEFGEQVMEAVNKGTIDGDEAKAAREIASNSFTKARTKLANMRDRLGKPDPETDREKWRLRNRAWYELCSVIINESLTFEKNSTKYVVGLETASRELEDFILENETDDEEALLGALYGYLLRGRVFEALDDPSEALASYTGVIDFIRWENTDRLVPIIQALAEQSYYSLLKFLISIEKFDDALKYGNQFVKRWDERDMVHKRYGRAALVQVAEARLRTGDMNGALQLSSKVVEEAGGDATGRLANQLVAEIIAQATDKTQFAPAILRSAAKGAFAAGEEKYEDSIAYFHLLLQVLDQVQDADDRAYYRAEAYYMMGRALRLLGRNLEASFAFGEGFRNGGHAVAQDKLNVNLARYWSGTLKNLANDTGSEKIRALNADAAEVLIKYPTVGGVSEQVVRYDEGRELEREAKDLRKNDPRGAVAKYEQSAAKYAEAAKLDGPKKEQALMRVARTRLTIADILFDNGDAAQARPLVEKATADFKDYLRISGESAQPLSNPAAATARADARAIARYSISKANSMLMPSSKSTKPADKAERERLMRDSIKYTTDYETEVEGQKQLKLAVVYERLTYHIELGEFAKADQDLAVLRELDPRDSRTAGGSVRIGKVLRDQVEPKFKELMGKIDPTKPREFQAQIAKPEVQALLPELRRAYGYYRDWLLAGGGSKKFDDWNFVSSKYYKIGDFDATVDLVGEMLNRFGNSTAISDDNMVSVRRRMLFSAVELAQAAEAAGDDAKAGSLWSQAGRMADILIKSDNKFAKYASTRRAMAIAYGGYLAEVTGRFTYRPALGRFAEARELWESLESSLRAKGNDDWWEAKFYTYYATWKALLEKGHSTAKLGTAIESLEATTGSGFGGKSWRRQFKWLQGQVR